MQTRIRHITIAIMLGLACAIPMLAQAAAPEGGLAIADGKEVSIEYILRLEDQKILDSNIDGEPLLFVYGAKQIIPGLERELEGMKAGERKKVTVKPVDAYGEIRKEAFIEVDKSQVPSEGLEVGSYLQTGDGNDQLNVKVVEIKENTVVLDGNHPLAGKTLYFEVLILDVKEAAGK